MRVDLHEVINGISDLLSASLYPGITIKEVLTAETHTIDGDLPLLEATILHLALSGLDVLHDEGCLELRTDQVELNQRTWQRVQLGVGPGSYLRLSIAATGRRAGPARSPSRALGPFCFASEHNQAQLKLTTVNAALDRHCAGIRVVTAPGRGVRFDLCFPAVRRS